MHFFPVYTPYSEAEDGGDGAIVPTWMAVDNDSVLTQSELWKVLQQDNWSLEVRLLVH
jgi:hypothetical protein